MTTKTSEEAARSGTVYEYQDVKEKPAGKGGLAGRTDLPKARPTLHIPGARPRQQINKSALTDKLGKKFHTAKKLHLIQKKARVIDGMRDGEKKDKAANALFGEVKKLVPDIRIDPNLPLAKTIFWAARGAHGTILEKAAEDIPGAKPFQKKGHGKREALRQGKEEEDAHAWGNGYALKGMGLIKKERMIGTKAAYEVLAEKAKAAADKELKITSDAQKRYNKAVPLIKKRNAAALKAAGGKAGKTTPLIQDPTTNATLKRQLLEQYKEEIRQRTTNYRNVLDREYGKLKGLFDQAARNATHSFLKKAGLTN